MDLPSPRGPLSRALVSALGSGSRLEAVAPTTSDITTRATDPLSDEDLHLTLWVLYELHYRGFDGVDPAREWDPELISHRRDLETLFESALRAETAAAVERARQHGDDVVEQIQALIELDQGPDLPRHVQRHATVEQVREFMVQRSLYHLKESDPTSFVLPRVDGAVKAALAELQYDEYGGGRPGRLHAHLFAQALEGCDLDPAYGAYVDEATGATLASNNAMSLFGLNRRLRGASLGHLATFEATSTMPCRRIAAGVRRLGLDDRVWDYFDEHVEADAVHEEVALRSICGRLVEEEPDLRDDVLFGAATCLAVDGEAAAGLLRRWGVLTDDREPECVSA